MVTSMSVEGGISSLDEWRNARPGRHAKRARQVLNDQTTTMLVIADLNVTRTRLRAVTRRRTAQLSRCSFDNCESATLTRNFRADAVRAPWKARQ